MVKKKYRIKKSLFKSNGFKKAAFLTLFAFISVAFFAFGGLDLVKSAYVNVQKMFAGEEELGRKELTDNQDGTYNLSLTVKGQAEKKPSKLNVIVIVDKSGSMDADAGTGEVTYTPTTDNGNPRYGLVNGEYVQLTRVDHGRWANPRYTYSYNGTNYTGTRYIRTQAEQSRMEATREAVNNLAENLFANNGGEHPDDTVEMALVSFATTAQTHTFSGSTKTKTYSAFETAVNGINTPSNNNERGTNWEAALQAANTINFGDQDPTFVIFFSDGNPTFRLTRDGHNDEYGTVNGVTVYGTGQEGNNQTTNMNRSYDNAKDDATTLATKVGKDRFYTIFAYGQIFNNTDYMKNLTTDAGAPSANNYNASNTVALQQAFADILAKIEMAGISDATINDGTTNNVVKSDNSTAELLEVDETSYKYWRTVNGERTEWKSTDEPAPPAATLVKNGENKGHVVWDLSELHLLDNDVIYEVTFDVYPSQFTYDTIADLKNGKYTYNSLDSEIKKYLKEDGNGGYTLRTNTTANMTYKDTRITDPNDPAYGTQTYNYTNPEPVATDANELVVQKLWDNDIDKRNATPITIELKKNGTVIETFSLSNSNDFKDHTYIPTGLLRTRKEDPEDHDKITGIQVLDTGYEFSLNEPTYANGQDRYWEFSASTIRPMIVDGVLSTLVKVENEEDIPTEMSSATYAEKNGNQFFKIDGSVYYLKDQATEEEPNKMTFEGTNSRKSVMEVKKLVKNDAPAGEEFKFTFNITNSTDKEVWFSVCDNSKVDCSDPDAYQAVTGLNTTATPEEGDTGYYHVNNGVSFDVYMQKDYNLRFINLGTGSTYSVEEEAKNPYITTIEADTIVSSVRELPLTAVPQADGKTWIDTDGTEYEKKTDEDGMTYYEFTYRATRTGNKVEGSVIAANTAFTVTYTNTYPRTFVKVTKEWNKKTGDPVTVKLYENGNESSLPAGTLSSDNDWTYTFKDLEVKDGNGKQIEYNVKEVPVPTGYTESYDGTTDVLVKASNVPEGTDEITVTIGDKSITLTRDKLFEGTINGVDFVEDNGNLITIEEPTTETEGVTLAYELTNRNITITNSELTDATVVKEWNDDNDRDGLREAVEMTLVKDKDTENEETVTTVTVDADHEWKATVSGLDKYDGTREIVYSWKETVPTGYTQESITTNDQTRTTTIKNKHVPATKAVTAVKAWEDEGNQDGKRPTSITLTLLANDQPVKNEDNENVTVTLSPSNNWSASISGLFVKEAGEDIEYSWSEPEIDEYELDDEIGTQDVTDENGNVTTILTLTNNHEVHKTSRTIIKSWNDKDNQDGIQPTSVDVTLMAGEDEVETVTLNAGNSWTATIDNLDVYADGVEIVYSWVEEDLTDAGYTQESSEVTDSEEDEDGYLISEETTIKNKHEPETIDITAVKAWEDEGNQDGKRPTSITLTLTADDQPVKDDNNENITVTLSSSTNWSGKVEGLPKNKAVGVAINYSWSEPEINEYELDDEISSEDVTDENGNITRIITLTNNHDVHKTSRTVTKVWDDEDNQDGKQPTSLKVTLMAGEEEVETVTLDADNEWTATVDDLDVYADGVEIVYSWVEEEIDEYTLTSSEVTDSEEDEDGYLISETTTLTNTHEVHKTSRTVTKVWDDTDNQDGKQPTSLKVTLMAGEEEVETVTLDADNEWTATVDDLDVYADGVEIEYSWVEEDIDEYTLTSSEVTDSEEDEDGYLISETTTLTNTHEVHKTSRTVTKVWDDEDNQDGKQPESLKVTLMAGEEEVETVTLDADNEWTATVDDLDVYADGIEIEYSWVEEDIDEYTLTSSVVTDSEEDEDGYIISETTTITNTHEVHKTSRTVVKVWDDNNNQDGKQPTSLDVTLMAGEEEVETVTLTAGNEWTATVSDLDVYADGVEIEYSWVEAEIDDYTLTSSEVTASENDKDGYLISETTTLTNSHSAEKTARTVVKVWNDDENQDGMRPESLTIKLLADKSDTGKSVTVSASTNWSGKIDNLDVYKGGKEIVYSWKEADIDEYTLDENAITEVEETDDEGNVIGTIITLKNTHESHKTSRTVTKVWDDEDDQDGKQPESIEVTLMAGEEEVETVTLNAGNSWTATVSNLDMYADGEEIEYSWVEEEIDEYTLTSSEVTDSEEDEDGYLISETTTLTNTHEVHKTSRTVTKVWDDEDDQDGKQPESLSVTLKADGKEVETVTLNSDNEWTATVGDLDIYADGEEIEYSWVEEDIDEYTLTSSVVTDSEEDEDGYLISETTTITNKHEIHKTSRTVVKVWDDKDNQDGKQPKSVDVTLMAGEEEVETVTLNAENSWTATVSDLDMYADGEEIEYTWVEEDLSNAGYSLKSSTVTASEEDEDGYLISETTTITNTHETESTSRTVVKVWDDADDQDGMQPDSIVVTLMAGDSEVEDVTLNADNEWTATVENLDVYAGGETIDYSWTEKSVPQGYRLLDPEVNGFTTTLTNKHDPILIDLTVVKSWDDNEDQDGMRPAKIKVQLLANGTQVREGTLEPEGWSTIFTELPKYADGEEIDYTVTETDVEGNAIAEYSMKGEPVKSEDGSTITITNTHTISKTHICVTKEWVDNDDQDGYRPESIIINLLAQKGENSAVPVATYTLTADDTDEDGKPWYYSFEDLDEYFEGSPIVYTIEEVSVDEYTSEISGDAENGYTVTNTHNPEKTQVTVEKVWDDNDNQDGMRAPITITLVKDGEETDQTIELNEGNGYSNSFTNLDKKEKDPTTGKGGKVIEYTVTESGIDGYEQVGEAAKEDVTDEEGNVIGVKYTITNHHDIVKTKVDVEKIWDTTDNIYGFELPESVTIILNKNGAYFTEKTITAEDGWKWSFTDLDMYENGEKIDYSIDENPILDYTKTVDQKAGQITNKYTPTTREVVITKTWKDKDDQDGQRPTEIVVDLVPVVNGVELDYSQEVTIPRPENAGDEWSYTVEGLPKYDNGVEIVWIAKEHDVPGYERTDEEITLEITNEHTPATVNYIVTKVWDDEENNDGMRPESITYYLLADGESVAEATVFESNNWTATFTGLPMYKKDPETGKGGIPIVYTIKEKEVANYEEPEIVETDEGFEVTNTHILQKIDIHITKTWNDKDNQYNFRPDFIMVDVFADGELIQTLKITERDNWEATISQLPQFVGGHEIVYEIKERPIANYIISYNDKYNIENTLDPGIEIIPPDTSSSDQGKNIGIIYLLTIIVGLLTAGFKKVFE